MQEQTAPTIPDVIVPKPIPPEIQEKLAAFDLSACMSCGSCSSGCPSSVAPDNEAWDTRKALRYLSLGYVDEVVWSNWPWICTGCGRCTYRCPQGIDIVPIMFWLKSLRPGPDKPGTLYKGMQNNLTTGNNLAIELEDYLEGFVDLGNELAEEECPGFFVPVDVEGADTLFFPNSKEVFGDFEDQFWWWKIFYAAKENWTVPSEGWEAVDWALFSGEAEGTRTLAQRKIDYMKRMGIKRMIMPDCGGGSYGCRSGFKSCIELNEENRVDFMYLYEYLVKLFKEGRIKVDKSVHAGKVFTFHDSCKHGRELLKHYGQAFFEEPRWILSQCVDEYVDMWPNRAANYCCGAGGGNWPLPFEKQSAFHSRYKYEQIKRSGANVVVTGCSNCRDQMMKRIPKFFDDCDYEVKYIWQVVAEALVIEPWSDEEVAQATKRFHDQCKKFGINPEGAEI